MPDIEHEKQLAAELRAMREELAALKTAVLITQAPVMLRHSWLKVFIRDLETNPDTQYKVHRIGVIYWLVNFPLVTLLFFFEATIWLKWGIFITLIYSIYANLATDYGGMSAAMAIYGRTPLPPIPLEPSNGNGSIVTVENPGGDGKVLSVVI